MPKAAKSKSKSKGGYYAVAVGFEPGIYTIWPEAQKQPDGYSCWKQEKFPTLQQAEAPYTPVRRAVASGAPLSPSKKGKKRPSPFDDVPVDEEHLWEIVYTDGAGSNNGKGAYLALAGVGVWFGHGDTRNISERCPGDQTNNRAELIAIIRALEEIPPGSKPLLIKTDLNYSIDSVCDWVPNFLSKSQKLLNALEAKGSPPSLFSLSANLEDFRRVKFDDIDASFYRQRLVYIKTQLLKRNCNCHERLSSSALHAPRATDRISHWRKEKEVLSLATFDLSG